MSKKKKLFEEDEELFNLEDGANEVFVMEEEENDELRRQRASNSHCVMQAMSEISKPKCSANLDRKKEKRGKDLLEDYFIPNNVFIDDVFRRHFRMQGSLFNKIMIDVATMIQNLYKKKERMFFHVISRIPEQKIIATLWVLAYGVSADQVVEITRTEKSTALESDEVLLRN
ncbi:uncharacterized protein [Malus domestica]|uniref:uncharacterized protein n=1 Tax=Malus domestica TaxID=3750 RepID=UPI003975E1DB